MKYRIKYLTLDEYKYQNLLENCFKTIIIKNNRR